MAYVLNAFFARADGFDAEVRNLPQVAIVELPQSFAMALNTVAFQETFGSVEQDRRGEPVFYHLHPATEAFFVRQSRNGPIVYLEIELFGGSGTRAAVVWHHGQVISGPVSSETTDPVNPALKQIGVSSSGFHDEFAALGLGRYRTTEEWIGTVQTAPNDPILDYPVSSGRLSEEARAEIKRLLESQAAVGRTQKEVEAFMEKLDYPLKAEVEALRTIIKSVSPDITEQIKWNAPSYRTTDYIATFNFHDPKQIRLVFHNAAIASILSDILEGDYVDRRLVYFADMQEVEAKKAELVRVIRKLIKNMDIALDE